jgi:hypothetical protein
MSNASIKQLQSLLNAGVLTQAEYDAATGGGSASGRIEVCASGTGQFTDLGEAIRDAAPGSTLAVKPGLYRCQEIIDKNLDIVATGPGVVILPLTANEFHARYRKLLDEAVLAYDTALDRVLDFKRIEKEMKATTFNLFKLRKLTAQYKATFSANNPEIGELESREQAIGDAFADAVGKGTIFTICNARVRLEGLKMAFPPDDATAYSEHSQVRKLARPRIPGASRRICDRWVLEESQFVKGPKSKSPWREGGGMVNFRASEDGHRLVIEDCSFHGGDTCTRGVSAKSESADAELVIKGCNFEAFFISRKERGSSEMGKTTTGGVFIEWPQPEHAGDYARVLVADCKLQGGFSGARVTGGHAVFRKCTFRDSEMVGLSVCGQYKADVVSSAEVVSCTFKNTGEHSILGWRGEKERANITYRDCKIESVRCYMSKGAVAAQESRLAIDRAKKAEAERKKQAAADAKRQQAEARRAASQPRPAAAAPSRPSQSSSDPCEWCGTPTGNHYHFRERTVMFMTYRKGIFCSSKCLKHARWSGVEGTTHVLQGGRIVPFEAME